jgi:hypothetical protein
MTAETYLFPGRTLVAVTVVSLILALVIADLSRSGGIDPFSAPPPLALGSGQAPSGAHCTGS